MAFVAPQRPSIQIGDVSYNPFCDALELYARTREAENREEESRRSLLRLTETVGVRMPEETASGSDAPPAPPPDTHTHTAGTNDDEGVKPAPFVGYAAGEKREIYAHMMAFVASHGLGARRKIAEASNGALTLEEVQAMTDCGRVPLSKWRVAAAAMDWIEEQKQTQA